MSESLPNTRLDSSGLRERNTPQHTPSPEIAKETVLGLNAEEFHSNKSSKDKRTFGRTPDGVGKSQQLSHNTTWPV